MNVILFQACQLIGPQNHEPVDGIVLPKYLYKCIVHYVNNIIFASLKYKNGLHVFFNILNGVSITG